MILVSFYAGHLEIQPEERYSTSSTVEYQYYVIVSVHAIFTTITGEYIK